MELRRPLHTPFGPEDPGWTPGAGGSVLSLLRLVFLAFCAAIVALGVAVPFVADRGDDASITPAVPIVLALGAFGLVSHRLATAPLDGSSAEALRTSFQSRFFVRLATGEVVALVAFVLGLAMGPWWVYYVALPFTLVAFARAAPTRANLARDDEMLAQQGSMLSLVDVLTGERGGSGSGASTRP